MCGIAGVWSLHFADREAAIIEMTDLVVHRGPDGEGHVIWSAADDALAPAKTASELRRPNGPFVYLGHRRLSIIDLSSAGSQPMMSSDQDLTVVFNGEIYNYIELREELRARGHEFTTQTDTEVILAAFREWGEGCFHRFNGMWALAILCRRDRQLILSIDRFGVKPLHICASKGCFAFGSEIKQLLKFVPAVRGNADVLADFFKLGITNHRRETCFGGIERLLPGEVITLALDTGDWQRRRWYSLAHNDEFGLPDNSQFARIADDYRSLLCDAVRVRLRSDVPVGSCLSGGLDSSAIVALASIERGRNSGSPLKTFTTKWTDPRIDESAFARAVVDMYGCDPSWTSPSPAELEASLDDVLWHQEEPFATSSILAQWAVMKLARAHNVPVLLDGQGADELLAGYSADCGFQLAAALQARSVGGLSAAFRMARGGLLPDWRAAARVLLPGLIYRVKAGVHQGSEYDWVAPRNLGTALFTEFTGGPLQTLLRFEDRNSMAHSIESRCPFMDYRLVEFVFAQPRWVLSSSSRTKQLTRTALSRELPSSVRERRNKLGFAAPEIRLGTGAPKQSWRNNLVLRWRKVFNVLGDA